jgi:hypothetical protein
MRLDFLIDAPRWMFEKYDGIRVYYSNGKLRTSKHNQEIMLSQQIQQRMPNFAFEGELWYYILL